MVAHVEVEVEVGEACVDVFGVFFEGTGCDAATASCKFSIRRGRLNTDRLLLARSSRS